MTHSSSRPPAGNGWLADNGHSNYVIVIPADAIPAEQHAAAELRSWLRESTGANFPIVVGTPPADEPAIFLGCGPEAAQLAPLAPEEFVIRRAGQHLVIAGGRPRGVLYGVYQFLEDAVGCRWYAPQVEKVPRHAALPVPELDLRAKPALEYREPFFREAFDPDWAARNRANSSHAALDARHGGRVSYGGKSFVHTFDPLVPVAEHFAEHPEYFSLIDGQRTADHTQLCLTNPEVLRLVIDGVRRWIREAPEATLFSVSQNDWRNPCQCPSCQAIDEREGSHSGTMLWFVNQVAEAIEAEAPHVAIDTLAYQYTRKPPKTLRPRPNVIVRLCSIECCFAHPLESCPENASFVADVEGWSQICNRLYVWDYVTNFLHYVLPWPNLEVLAANVRFYARHHVVGLFEQGSYSPGGGGEFAELRAYLLARLMWNPEADEKAIVDEYLDGVYGPAAPFMRDYLALLHEPIKDPEHHLHIFADLDQVYLDDELVRRGDQLLARAEAAADSADGRERVRRARLPIQYVALRRLEDGPERTRRLEQWVATARRAGMTDIGEGRSIDRWLAAGARKPAR